MSLNLDPIRNPIPWIRNPDSQSVKVKVMNTDPIRNHNPVLGSGSSRYDKSRIRIRKKTSGSVPKDEQIIFNLLSTVVNAIALKS
jgi:hypothetical protein